MKIQEDYQLSSFFHIMISVIITILLLPVGNSLHAVKFFYYSTKNPDIPIELTPIETPPMVNNSRKSWQRIKILCHGWQSNSTTTDWLKPTVTKYLESGESNVIAVDWGIYANQIYPLSVLHVPSVGRTIGEAIINISREWNVPFRDFHLIGHSMGVHTLGFAGKYIIQAGFAKVGRITGLDPAGPGYNKVEAHKRLSMNDANLVDVIHTNSIVLGYTASLGHVDFWPNGGEVQLGCNPLTNCSHMRVLLYFIESINAKVFPAWHCHSKAAFDDGKCYGNQMIYMGEWTSRSIRGDFYLDTNAQSPFGKGVSIEQYLYLTENRRRRKQLT